VEILASAVLLLIAFLVIGLVTERYFIPSLENIAGWLRMSENVAGATLLAFGSSAPELFTALLTIVLAQSEPSFGVGNVIGSALFQILVVIGFAAAVKTSYLHWGPVIRDGTVYAIAVLLLFLFVRDGVFTAWEAAVLVGSYLLYLAILLLGPRFEPRRAQLRIQRRSAREAAARDEARGPRSGAERNPICGFAGLLDALPGPRDRPGWTVPMFLLSLLAIGGASWLLVRAGVDIARGLSLDPTIIALTIIAGGSSVPELFSSAIVARRGKGDMAIANALGSNSFDIFISLGLPMLIATLAFGDIEDVGGANITASTILLFATLVMVIGLLAVQRFKASRPFGILLMLCYAGYVLAAYRGWIG
jgi:K+-dependent Na+/Ca+ exchanger-like protein